MIYNYKSEDSTNVDTALASELYRSDQTRSTNRYIKIKDCLGGPLVIDRDTVNYGFIMSAKGKSFERLYDNIRSGDYLEEIDSYFFGSPPPPDRQDSKLA